MLLEIITGRCSALLFGLCAPMCSQWGDKSQNQIRGEIDMANPIDDCSWSYHWAENRQPSPSSGACVHLFAKLKYLHSSIHVLWLFLFFLLFCFQCQCMRTWNHMPKLAKVKTYFDTESLLPYRSWFFFYNNMPQSVFLLYCSKFPSISPTIHSYICPSIFWTTYPM